MPIYLQWLDEPSEQDRTDLDKLYADAPVQWLSEAGHTKGAGWAITKQKQGELVALGRFNDRIVCGACLAWQADSASLSHLYEVKQLCVRAITRERGVAKQLLVRLCQWANETQASLYVRDDTGDLTCLYELGFVQYLQGWRYTPL